MTPTLRTTLIGLSAVSLLAACGQQDAAKSGPGGMPPAEVSVLSVRRADVPVTVELPGRLQAVRSAQIRARVEGVVERRVFQEGSDVQAGALLFRLDGRTLAANVATAEANLAKARADAEVARATAERYTTLFADKAVSRQEFDQAVARSKQTSAEVMAANAALTRARIDLGHASVTAPISGHIGRALVSEGALVGKGEATHLATIEQMNPIWINFTESDSNVYRLRQLHQQGSAKAHPVELLLPDGSVYPHPGKLLFTDLNVDPSNGAIGMRAEFPNPDRLLLPGQFARIRLVQRQSGDAIVVPQRSVQATPQGQVVMLVNAEGKVEPRPVKAGNLSGNNWIIQQGLQGGEQVIVEGLQKARPGAPVKAVPYDPQAKFQLGAPPGGAKPATPAAPGSTTQPTPAPSPAAAAQPTGAR